MIHQTGNMLLVLGIIIFASLCGLGILQLCGLSNFRQRLLIAPGAILSISGILVAIVVILGIQIERASPFIWTFWIASAAYGIKGVRYALNELNQRNILFVSILVTLLVLPGYIYYGVFDYLGSPALDGWSYVSFGDYLNKYSRGVEGGLAPLYQYASHLSGTRYVASAMLAVLIPPWTKEIDTQMMVGPLLILSIFAYSTAVAYVCRVLNQRGLQVPEWITVTIGVVGGWVPLALHANNYDNLLALHFSPALFALALDQQLNKRGKILISAIFLAASVYVYPELSPVIVAAYCAASVEGFYAVQKDHPTGLGKGALVARHAAVAIGAVILVSPYLQDALRFFVQQLSSTSQMTGRPGEGIMPALLDEARIWGAMWGLGSTTISIVVGVALSQIALFGFAIATARKHIALVLYLSLIGVLFLVMVEKKHYDYGAYKILLVGWWAISIAVISGTMAIWKLASTENSTAQIYLKILILSTLAISSVLWLHQPYRWMSGYAYKMAPIMRDVRDVILNIDSGVQVSISDTTLNAWLVYQLRNAKVKFTEYRGYMDQAHVRPLMTRSKIPEQSETNYVLNDINAFTIGDVVWKNDSFILIKGDPEKQPPRININAPNGREVLGGKSFFWIGSEPASIVLTAIRQEKVCIEFEATLGPSVGASVNEYPTVSVDGADKKLLTFYTGLAKIYTMCAALSPGANVLEFRPTYAGSLVSNSNGDPRTLLVGIKLINITTND